LVFGPARLPLVSGEQLITIGQSDDSRPPSHLEIRASPERTHRFSRFAPLVHYRLDGDDTAFECLRLSLTSLVRYGRYPGPISIACDRPEESLLSYLPEGLHSRVTLARISAGDAAAADGGLDAALQDRHQPILLAAPSVIFDTNILDLLIDSLLEGRTRLSAVSPCVVGAGLRHFPEAPSEVGLRAMRSYLAALDRNQAATDDPRAVQLNLTLPGPMSGEELDRLARLARRVPRHGTIIEIGAGMGQSSWVLAANADPSVSVYCIEDWAQAAGEESAHSLTTFRVNLAPFANVIALPGVNPRDFVGWQREIDLLVENSGESDPALHGSLLFWRRMLQPQGIVCGRFPGEDAEEVLTKVANLAQIAGTELERTGNLWSFKLRSA
jgi:hypothetical protein